MEEPLSVTWRDEIKKVVFLSPRAGAHLLEPQTSKGLSSEHWGPYGGATVPEVEGRGREMSWLCPSYSRSPVFQKPADSEAGHHG